ncbi:ATP-dependent RNA helicase DED1-like [Maniola jurtina]|uniref:ATP-dependent RNA helicase DED1-like n=1 Tax=Maniola jurtina TaxID=191418 RepID=UPI001E689E93|nr:ATP-dependent RNA helicase DED1-like [Maniola jurtina]
MTFKLLLLCVAVVSVVGLSNGSSDRPVRSPAPSGWQGSSSFGSSPIGLARNGGGWGSDAPTLTRSNGWGGSAGYGANTRSYSNGKSGCANSNGWDESNVGFRSNSAIW